MKKKLFVFNLDLSVNSLYPNSIPWQIGLEK